MTDDEILAMSAGEDLDRLLAEALGWTDLDWLVPNFSGHEMEAFIGVDAVQQHNPGWRFSLLGGDACFPTLSDGDRYWTGDKREPFGWHAEFFGHEDPEQCSGQRHSSVYGTDRALVIAKACLLALRSKQSSPAP